MIVSCAGVLRAVGAPHDQELVAVDANVKLAFSVARTADDCGYGGARRQLGAHAGDDARRRRDERVDVVLERAAWRGRARGGQKSGSAAPALWNENASQLQSPQHALAQSDCVAFAASAMQR